MLGILREGASSLQVVELGPVTDGREIDLEYQLGPGEWYVLLRPNQLRGHNASYGCSAVFGTGHAELVTISLASAAPVNLQVWNGRAGLAASEATARAEPVNELLRAFLPIAKGVSTSLGQVELSGLCDGVPYLLRVEGGSRLVTHVAPRWMPAPTEVVLPATADLTGRVRYRGGRGAAGARVMIDVDSNSSVGTLVELDGEFCIHSVPVGVHDIKVLVGFGAKPIWQRVDVREIGTALVNVEVPDLTDVRVRLKSEASVDLKSIILGAMELTTKKYVKPVLIEDVVCVPGVHIGTDLAVSGYASKSGLTFFAPSVAAGADATVVELRPGHRRRVIFKGWREPMKAIVLGPVSKVPIEVDASGLSESILLPPGVWSLEVLRPAADGGITRAFVVLPVFSDEPFNVSVDELGFR